MAATKDMIRKVVALWNMTGSENPHVVANARSLALQTMSNHGVRISDLTGLYVSFSASDVAAMQQLEGTSSNPPPPPPPDSAQRYWVTKDGRVIRIDLMEDAHLLNAIARLRNILSQPITRDLRRTLSNSLSTLEQEAKRRKIYAPGFSVRVVRGRTRNLLT
jgi:hypothetical protein